MHLLLSIPSENQHLLKCVFIKKSFVYKSVCVVFIFKTKNTDAAFQPTRSSCTRSLMLRNQPLAILFLLVNILTRKVRIWDGKGK